MNYFINAPPSHGKSLMISLLANLLICWSAANRTFYPIAKVYVICFNDYLTKSALSDYSNKSNSAYGSGGNDSTKVVYISWHEFVNSNITVPKYSIAILDEIDQLALETIINVKESPLAAVQGKAPRTAFTMHKITQKLKVFSKVIGFTCSE